MNTNFSVKVLATNWGFQGTIEEYCSLVKKEGYDGIEIWWPTDKKEHDELFNALAKYGLQVGFLCGGHDAVFDAHLSHFKSTTTAAATNNVQKPLYINCHSGRDHFPFDKNRSFIEHTLDLSRSSGVTICHETHRARILFAAHIARQYMDQFPGLRITLDASHWCNVHESLLHDQEDTMNLAIRRTDHIHARIGHPEGPQVNDPRAPEWEQAVAAHFKWWDKIVELKKQRGDTLTILTEFGPPDYMPTMPFSRQALADQWAINVHMLNLLKSRYQ